jgi:hypothetical protein
MADRFGIELFARTYPHDCPEVQAMLMTHAHRPQSADGPRAHALADDGR